MTAIFSLLTVLTLSFLITRFGTAALAVTGVSYELARLQAISAFTGVGFTTSESEQIVGHPARRRILIVLMILGNAGIVTAVSTLILSFIGTQQGQWLTRGLLLVGGLAVLWCVATSQWIEQRMLRLIEAALRRFTRLEAIDFVELLELTGDYSVRTLAVEPGDWVEGKQLEQVRLFQEGITVLGIHRADGEYLGVPRGETVVEARDRLVLYGREQRIRELDHRRRGRSGDEAHQQAVSDQQQERRSQQQADEQRRQEAASESSFQNNEGPVRE